MRIGEMDNIDYHFISKDKFYDKLINKDFLEHREYEVENREIWHYGLDKNSIDLSINQLAILDAQGYYSAIKELGKENVLGIYIYTSERNKLYRALNREPNREDMSFFLELYRRLTDDAVAFKTMEDDINVYKVENVDLDKAIKKILLIIKNNIREGKVGL